MNSFSAQNLNPIPYSKKPDRLLRVIVSSECNYNCCFCCWQNKSKNTNNQKGLEMDLLLPDHYQFVSEAMVESGCTRIMLTGGEPLLLSADSLTQIIKAISFVQGIDDFWICSNGFAFSNRELCERLRAAGLRKVVVSIGAATNESYKYYTRSNEFDLDHILKGVANLVESGLHVKIDVPISKAGIYSYRQLRNLIDRLTLIGVSQVAYFRLHRTRENTRVYSKLFAEIHPISLAFMKDPKWSIQVNRAGQSVFNDGKIEVIIPTQIEWITKECKKRKCGYFCQGIYAAYLIKENNRVIIRACHHKFFDRNNEFEIRKILHKGDKIALKNIFSKVWQYAYFA